MKVWISKHALTSGVKELEVHSVSEDGNRVYGRAWDEFYHGKGKEWHESREDAILRAEEMRIKKIESLKKQIAKLEKMRFC